MKKKIILTITAILATAAMILLLCSNIRFIGIYFERHCIIIEAANGWTPSLENSYEYLEQVTEEFANQNDYQQWLVSSGGTYTGKMVRILVMAVELFILYNSSKVICWSLQWQIRQVTKWLRKLRIKAFKMVRRRLRRIQKKRLYAYR